MSMVNDVTVLISGLISYLAVKVHFNWAQTLLVDMLIELVKFKFVTSSPKWPNFHCKINFFWRQISLPPLVSACLNLQHLFSKLRKIFTTNTTHYNNQKIRTTTKKYQQHNNFSKEGATKTFLFMFFSSPRQKHKKKQTADW